MSDSLQPHGLYSPLYSPSQDTRVGNSSLLQGIKPRSPTLQVDSLLAEPPGKPKNTGVGRLSLLQRIFLTQEWNRGLLHCRWILYQLSYEGIHVVGTALFPVAQWTHWMGEMRRKRKVIETGICIWHTTIAGCARDMGQSRSLHHLWQTIISFFNLTPWGLLSDRYKNRAHRWTDNFISAGSLTQASPCSGY